MKKILTLSTLLFFCAFIPHVFAQGFVPLAGIPGLTQGATADTAGLANFFNNLYKYLIGGAAILAVIMIIWGGLEISTQDSISKKGAGREKIYNAIFGLVLVLSPALIFSIINPSILNLSLNLPPLDTAPGRAGGSGGTVSQAPATVDSNGCSVTGTLLKTATCPTQAAAQQFAATCADTGTVTACQTQKADGTCGDTTFKATCSSLAGPYTFLDVSSAYIPSLGSPLTTSSYQPLASSTSSANNGSAVMQFVGTCSQDGGTTCIEPSLFSVPCTYTTAQPSSQNNKCYSDQIRCRVKPSIPKLNCNPTTWAPIK